MKAIIVQAEKEDRDLIYTDVEKPTLQSGEVLVKVAAAGVNRGDILQAAGHYPPPPGASEIMGLECAGTIVDAGDTNQQVGTEVACLLAGGGYGEYVEVPEGQLMPIPKGFSLSEAASVVEVACTVWSNLGMLAKVTEGQRVLIHGGSGGIGSFAIQLCKALGAEVAVTAGSQDKLDYCRNLGADILINYREEDYSEVLKNSCDVILDIMGAKYLRGNMRALANDGIQVGIGLQGGTKAEINLGLLLAKRLTIAGTTLRGRSLEDKAAICRDTITHVWPLLEDGQIRHHIYASYPIAEAAQAHRDLVSGEVTGKLVLEF
ncbi:NAD(P)H-quinone oxidoreductase [Corynebacterium spheniscorum]|uniref:Putative NAD(P)H quinone oxidoreductase, PIG3 family n=1 Tax=Corynebacterium spheniscorum TaxID=185761 RepID=A0A1I2V0C5_9CORY|nr:NAD(P)H-quinone oxidoreductase [Corynebacterium spheniscorum]KAA8719758.1 NAD(P)H-quinone oxidoreductase [Corynebacterium spheniscorum]SFG82633.1 putative NAD(P)H quinone oxidoreductase, PIG3 family [Corynebacterium spheniscorum]